MHLTDYIPVHTFHNVCVFFSSVLLNHMQLMSGYNPKSTLLYHCYSSSLSCPILFVQLIIALEVQKFTYVKSIFGFTESYSNSFELIKFILNCNCILQSSS